MDTISLKKYIHRNEKIEYILDNIGCKHIKYHSNKEFYSCANYDGDNPSAINVRDNDFLNVKNWTRDFEDNADLITLVQYNKQMSFREAIKYLHNILGLEFKGFCKKQEIKPDVSNMIINSLAKYSSKNRVDVADLPVIDERVIDEYVPMLHIDWLKEGVIEKTRKKFGLCYSYRKKRVIIPIRHWLSGDLVGFNARTVVENYSEFGISKYFITPTYKKGLNLFGLYENYDSIVKSKYITIVESEKSVMKRHSLLDETCVALQGKSISDEQISIILGMSVDIVICLDKDVNINEVRFMCEKFYRLRNVYYIWDSWDLLKEKDSPVDADNKIYNFMFKHKVKYDEKQHQLFLKSLEKRM